MRTWLSVENIFLSDVFEPLISHAAFRALDRYKKNIEDMSADASMFVGKHSYFNFCKIDPSKGAQQSFNRNVLHASIEPLRPLAAAPHPLHIFVFNVKATAFLWHQVRAMVAILFRIGDGIPQLENWPQFDSCGVLSIFFVERRTHSLSCL
jgi:tRNA pseudouridine(38-40) synthase